MSTKVIFAGVAALAAVALLAGLLINGTFTTRWHVEANYAGQECDLDLDARSAERNAKDDSGHPQDILVFEASNGQYVAHEGGGKTTWGKVWCPGDPGPHGTVWDGDKGVWSVP